MRVYPFKTRHILKLTPVFCLFIHAGCFSQVNLPYSGSTYTAISAGAEVNTGNISGVSADNNYVNIFNAANKKYNKGQYSGAIKDYTSIIEEDSPGLIFYNACLMRAQSYKMLGQTDRALEDYELLIDARDSGKEPAEYGIDMDSVHEEKSSLLCDKAIELYARGEYAQAAEISSALIESAGDDRIIEIASSVINKTGSGDAAGTEPVNTMGTGYNTFSGQIPDNFKEEIISCSGNNISPDNPVIGFLYIDYLSTNDKEKTLNAAEIIGEITGETRQYEEASPDLSPAEKLKAVYDLLNGKNLFHAGSDDAAKDQSFISIALSEQDLDCEISAYIYLAVGEELGWPVYGVKVPGHIFIRWQNTNTRINYETTSGKVCQEKDYFSHEGTNNYYLGINYWENLPFTESLALYGNNAYSQPLKNIMDDKEKTDFLTAMINMSPENLQFYYWRSEAYSNAGDYDNAVADCDWILKSYSQAANTDSPAMDIIEDVNNRKQTCLYNKTVYYYNDKDYTRAAEASTALIDSATSEEFIYRCYYLRADSYYFNNQLNEALADYEFLISAGENEGVDLTQYGIDPVILYSNKDTIYFNRAVELFNDKDYDRAIDVLDNIIETGNGERMLYKAYYLRGQAYDQTGRTDSALADYEFLISAGENGVDLAQYGIDPVILYSNKDTIYFNRAVELFNDKDYDRAIDVLDNIIETGSGEESVYRAYYLRGQAYGRTGRTDSALADYEFLISAGENEGINLDLYGIDASILYQNRDTIYFNRAVELFNDKDYDRAIDVLTGIIETGREESLVYKAYYLRSYSYDQTGQVDPALADYEFLMDAGENGVDLARYDIDLTILSHNMNIR